MIALARRLAQVLAHRGAAWILVVAGMLVVGSTGAPPLAGSVRGEEPMDAPLPEITLKQLAARLREAWAAYDKGLLEITFETTANSNWRFMMNQGSAAEQAPIIVRFPGRVRFQRDGRLWRVDYDSKMPRSMSKELSAYAFRAGFDGEQLYCWDKMRNELTLGETTGGAENWRPLNQFWEQGESFAHALEAPMGNDHSVAIGQRTVDGVRCYVVERTYSKPGTRTEEIVSPRQGYLLLRTTWSRKGKPYHIHSLFDVHQVAPGFWAPGRIVEESRSVHDDGAEQLDRKTESRVVRYEPEKTIAAEEFAFEPPYGVDVTDRRIGYSYHNDPWWPEAGALLRERFDWPKSDLSPLKSLGSPAKFEGKSAPPITAVAWINSKPLELAKLKGKVVLVEFWGTWCPPCRQSIPAMRTLYETYRPAGLEIISLHTPTEDSNAVRRFAHEFRMEYPIAIDSAGKEGGVTSGAFSVTGYPCAFLIDHHGGVHTVGEPTQDGGRLVQTLVSLLEKAGAKDVRTISLDLPQMSDEMDAAVREALPKWVAVAPTKATIRGRIVDGQGRPIVGANVSASLKLTLLIFSSPGGYQIFAHPRQYQASTGNDGRFEITGLTKGFYALKFEAPGRAWLERDVPIGPDLRSQEVEIALEQGDAISGLVRDVAGQPIAGANVDPTKWHHRNSIGGEVSTTPSGAHAVKSGADGRFQLRPLRQGRFTLEVTAPGFETRICDPVPSGTDNAELILERSKSPAPAKR